MNPDLGSGWAAHINGVGAWMESLGPASFSSGILRTLFVGFKPLLVGFSTCTATSPSLITALVCV